MPLTYQYSPIPSLIWTDGDRDLTSVWCAKYNVVVLTAPASYTLSSLTTPQANAEIIIRNYFSSTDAITIVQGAGIANIDVSGDLGLVIPPGGIGELKRIGNSQDWSFYGYIEA